MKRVVITGMGIISSIGNNVEEVLASLKAGKSGITASEQFKEHGLRSQVWGDLKINPEEHIDRKQMRLWVMRLRMHTYLLNKRLLMRV